MHEKLHRTNLYRAATSFDKELHALAGSGCGTRTCCGKKIEYLEALWRYYVDLTAYDDARLDYDDYPTSFSDMLTHRIQGYRIMFENAWGEVVKMREAMKEACGGQ